jgi:hypothetical protein
MERKRGRGRVGGGEEGGKNYEEKLQAESMRKQAKRMILEDVRQKKKGEAKMRLG